MITTEFIFLVATIVFLLMVIGIILTMHEFEKLTDEPSLRKGAGSANTADVYRDGHGSHG